MSTGASDDFARRIASAIGGRRPDEEIYFSRVRYVHRVGVSAMLPGPPVVEQQREQRAFLDRCLNEPPGGRIIGREVLTGTFQTLGQNGDDGDDGEGNGNGVPGLVHTRTEIFHVGFERKPYWLGRNG